MRAAVKQNSIALFSPQGFLDGANASSLLTIQDIQATYGLKVDMVLISLKKVVFFNTNGVTILTDVLHKFQKKMHLAAGFCDYKEEQFEAFFRFYDGQIPFSLFKTLEIALMFAAKGSSAEDNPQVLVYNDDSTQRSMQAIELYDKGYAPVVSVNKNEFLRQCGDKERFEAIVDQTYLGLLVSRIAAKTRGNTVIYFLKGFLDGTVTEQFDITYHQNSLKVGFQLFMFDATRVNSLNIHAANFFAKLSTAGAEYGALIAIVGLEMDKTPKAFREELEDAGILFFADEDAFFNDETVRSMSGGGSMVKKKKGVLDKRLVASLPVFVNATIRTLQMMTDMIAIKEDMVVAPLDCKISDMMASSIAFYGGIEGMISLVMPREMVQRACSLLLGEESDSDAELSDALSELVNIIAGKSKSDLQDKETKIDITLPRSYSRLEELLGVAGEEKGVQINFKFDDYPFIFYLSA